MTTQQKFNNWLGDIIVAEKPEITIIAYWFGLFESTEGYEIYLIGTKTFDEDDPDWVCNPDFIPKNKYLTVGLKDAEWQSVLEEVKKYLTNYLN